MIDRGVRTPSMRIAGRTITECVIDATFEGICLPGLTSIEVIAGGACCDLDDAGVRMIATGCVNLLNFELVDCQRLTCQSLATIGQHCKALTSLDISKCKGIRDEGVKALAQGCVNLQSINLTHCNQLTDPSLAAIGATCSAMKIIDMSDNTNMTDIGIASLTQGCSQLKTIDILDCTQLLDAPEKRSNQHSQICVPVNELQLQNLIQPNSIWSFTSFDGQPPVSEAVPKRNLR